MLRKGWALEEDGVLYMFFRCKVHCIPTSCLLYRFFRPPFRHSGLMIKPIFPHLIYSFNYFFFLSWSKIKAFLKFWILVFHFSGILLEDYTKHEELNSISWKDVCILITGLKNESFFWKYFCKICAPKWPGIWQDRLLVVQIFGHGSHTHPWRTK